MVNRPSCKEIAACVDRAIEKLMVNDAELLDINVNERSVSHKLAEYLQQEFTGWNVDCEYNRKMRNLKTLNVSYEGVTDQDTVAKTVFPDIIVHHRQTDDNLLVIEMKKEGMDTNKDEAKLKAFTRHRYAYRFGLLLVLEQHNDHEMQWFAEGKLLDPPAESSEHTRATIKNNVKVLGHGG